ncbi:MAG: lysophospholipid acyltransferase family protein, partial [Planctomycetota bacterium]
MMFDARRRTPTRSALNLFIWWKVVRDLVYAWLWVWYRLRCSGSENVPRRGPVIYVVNHQSYYDPPIAGCLVTDRPFVAMARATLFRSKVFSWVMRQIGAIPVDQERADLTAIRAMIAELRGGGCVLIFPEGQRTPDGNVGAFSPGLLTIVKRSKAPVLPVAIEGAFDVWPRPRKR